MPTPLPLIKKPKGAVTYEHSLAERLPGDIYMGASERNLYVDRYEEICLCAYYNIRVPGKYEFIPEYHFYLTKSRKCLTLYWSLGHMDDESEIIEVYHSLEEAKSSAYCKHFCDLKENIDRAIVDKKKRHEEYKKAYPVEPCNSLGENLYEVYDKESRRYVQLYLKNRKEICAVSHSMEPIHDYIGFFPDFIELFATGLHLIKDYHAAKEDDIPEGTAYARAAECLKATQSLMNRLRFTSRSRRVTADEVMNTLKNLGV